MASNHNNNSGAHKQNNVAQDLKFKTCHNEARGFQNTQEDEDTIPMLNHLRYISKIVIQNGEWNAKPMDYAVCKVKITDVSIESLDLDQFSSYFSTSFDGTMKIGEADTDLDRLLELCVQGMFPKETSQFVIQLPTTPICQSKYEAKPCIKGTVKCTVYLQDVFNEKLFFDWNNEMKLKVAVHCKEKGNELFRAGRIIDAFLRFSKAFKIVVTLGPIEMFTAETDEGKNILALRVNLLNNMASCQLHEKNFDYVFALSRKVLQIDADNVKALYRLAVASKELQKYDVAEESLKKVLKLEPKNTAAKDKLQEVEQLMKEMNERYVDLVKKMFKV